MATTAAFFDLDKTVIAKSSTLAFGKPFYKAGFVGRRTLMKMGFGQLFYVLFGADEETLERSPPAGTEQKSSSSLKKRSKKSRIRSSTPRR